jgi:drug/metabolite transporter (DMT)-like permease
LAQVERLRKNLTQPGILAALGAALLFGSGTPLAKLLLADVSPWLMAALLYLGSGIGLTLYRRGASLQAPVAQRTAAAGIVLLLR